MLLLSFNIGFFRIEFNVSFSKPRILLSATILRVSGKLVITKLLMVYNDSKETNLIYLTI